MVVREEVRLMTYDCGAVPVRSSQTGKVGLLCTMHIQVDEFQVGHRKF